MFFIVKKAYFTDILDRILKVEIARSYSELVTLNSFKVKKITDDIALELVASENFVGQTQHFLLEIIFKGLHKLNYLKSKIVDGV